MADSTDHSTVAEPTHAVPSAGSNNVTRLLTYADLFIFAVFLLFLVLIIVSSARANIQTDSIDYYAILQKLIGHDRPPIVENLHFMEQRSPGYSLASAIPYYAIAAPLGLLAPTERIASLGQDNNVTVNSENAQIPSLPLLARDIFFNDFQTGAGGWYEWQIALALLITSFTSLLAGIYFTAKMLRQASRRIAGLSLVPLAIFTAPIFMRNIVDTPAYATLFAFGLSAVSCYFFLRAYGDKGRWDGVLCGIFLGLLALARLETVLLLAVMVALLLVGRRAKLAGQMTGGALVFVPIMLAYNYLFFGNPLHMGILAGDINHFGLNLSYIWSCLFDPSSGIVFWSALISIGILGLLLSGRTEYRILGVCSLVLIGLYAVRIPVMYEQMGAQSVIVGGIQLQPLSSAAQAVDLVRSDMNRYVIVLAPFALLGLSDLASRIAACVRHLLANVFRARSQ